MLKKVKLISLVTLLVMVICTINVNAQTPTNLDEYLLEAGFPSSVIEKMSESYKQFVYENTIGKNLNFCSYETKEFSINDDGNLIENTSTNISPCSGTISSSDMTMGVIGATTESADGISYTVLPSFVWHVVKKVKNDSFSMSMYSGWEAIPGERNFRLHYKNSYGNSTYVDIAPSGATSSGYTFKIPSNQGAVQGLYEGYAYYDLRKTSSSASPNISLHYVHDASTNCNVSYGISIGIGSISLSGNSNNLYVMADNYTVSDLY